MLDEASESQIWSYYCLNYYDKIKASILYLVTEICESTSITWILNSLNWTITIKSINWRHYIFIRYGGTILECLVSLYNQGGAMRFYQGVSYAIVQGPLSRFGSVAANEGNIHWTIIIECFIMYIISVGARELVKILYINNDSRNVFLSTGLGSILAAIWRILLMPIDTCKTVLQVEGNSGEIIHSFRNKMN